MKYRIHLSSLKRAFFLAVQLGCLLYCCGARGAGEGFRTYNYKGFGANGALLVQGIVTLRVGETVQVWGDWRLQVLDRDKLNKQGPQDGCGKIVGHLKGDTIFLNLNPDLYENNIFLDGKVSGADLFKINGKWGYYGFAGRVNQGTFEMVRRTDPPR